MSETLERSPALVFVIVFAALWTWESLGAARTYASDRRRRVRNLTISVINFLLGGLTATVLLAAADFVARSRWGLAGLDSVPAWSVVVAGVLLLDVTDYWRHRVSHALPWLWRLHRLHHSDARMDVTTSLRSHPVELLLRPVFLGASILAFGIAPLAVIIHALLQLVVLLFQHANVRLAAPVDRAIALLVATPAMHLVHHSRLACETDSNYATALTLWDRLFRSFTPYSVPAAIGLDGFDGLRHQSLGGMLATPWRDAATTQHGP
jgi:sterol desaturase/sphingolipid hydroxylase (fatty acid hydroxylase superfamily)